MTRFLCVILSMLLTGLNPLLCLADTAQTTLEEGTIIRLKLGEAISTKTSAAGQKLELTVLEDVLSKDGKTVVIKEGAPAIGYLTNLDEKDGGKGGKISLDITSVKAIDGTKIPLRGTQAKSGHGGAGVGSYVVGGLLLGVVGLGVVALCGKSGHAKMPAGTILNAYVERDTTLAMTPNTVDKVTKEPIAIGADITTKITQSTATDAQADKNIKAEDK